MSKHFRAEYYIPMLKGFNVVKLTVTRKSNPKNIFLFTEYHIAETREYAGKLF